MVKNLLSCVLEHLVNNCYRFLWRLQWALVHLQCFSRKIVKLCNYAVKCVILRGFALTHSLMECILKPPPLNICTLVFSNYCHQMEALWLWQHVNVDGSVVGRRESLTDVEITNTCRDPCSKNSLTTQEKSNLKPEDLFSPSACTDTDESFPVLLWHSLSFPHESSFLCMTHMCVEGLFDPGPG